MLHGKTCVIDLLEVARSMSPRNERMDINCRGDCATDYSRTGGGCSIDVFVYVSLSYATRFPINCVNLAAV